MSNPYSRTKDLAIAMQVQHQEKTIRANSRREGNDKRAMIRNNRQMCQQAMAVKKSSEEETSKAPVKAQHSMDAHIYIAHNSQDTRRPAPVNASQKAAKSAGDKKIRARQGSVQVPTPVRAAKPAETNIRQRAQANRQYSPTEIEDDGAIYSRAGKVNGASTRSFEVQARRTSAVEKRDQPRIVRAQGISNTPSTDSRRARLLEQKLRAMSASRK